MKTFPIKIGKGRNPVVLDSAHLIDGCALIQGTRGSGKSYLARVIIEETIGAKLQTIVLDPEGEFSTLREKCDLLIAGRDGDVPCEPRSAKLLARRIAETGVSAVIDLSDLKLDQRREMVATFLDTLCSLPRKLEAPRLVVLDEAHVYCPEAGKGKATSTDAVITLMSQGRKRGLGAILLTQRLSKLKKDAAAEAAHVLIGKTSPIDLPSAQDMLGITKSERESLRTLKRGTFYVRGPGLSIPEAGLIAIGKAKTTHPEPGSRYKTTTPPPKQAISRILKEFNELPPSKEDEEAQSLADLKKRVRELERELVKERKSTVKGVSPKQVKAREDTIKQLNRQYDQDMAKYDQVLSNAQKQLRKTIAFLEGGVPKSERVELPPVREWVRAVKTDRTRTAAPRETAPARAEALPFGWSSAPGKMLTVLVQYYPEALAPGRLASLAGVNHKSSTFRNAMTKLRGCEVIHQEGNRFSASEDAANLYVDEVPPLPSGDALISGWKSKLGNGVPRKLFDALVAGGGGLHKNDAAADAEVDINSSTYRNALTKLRTYGLLEKNGTGTVLQLTPHVIEAL